MNANKSKQEIVSYLPVYYNTETREYWISATFTASLCGCEVIGGGNLPSPLRVRHCATHRLPNEQLGDPLVSAGALARAETEQERANRAETDVQTR